ncbi:hypothetical protein C8F01DRAFT_1143316 [Mycena amicta]|nr:hypothetical protein C8F01DRAFT_1143316 [Mycena amicta]
MGRTVITPTTPAAYLTPPTTRELVRSRCEDRSPAHFIATEKPPTPTPSSATPPSSPGSSSPFHATTCLSMWLSMYSVRLIPVGEHSVGAAWRFAQSLPRSLPEGLWTCMDVHSHALGNFLPFLGGIWLLERYIGVKSGLDHSSSLMVVRPFFYLPDPPNPSCCDPPPPLSSSIDIPSTSLFPPRVCIGGMSHQHMALANSASRSPRGIPLYLCSYNDASVSPREVFQLST